MRQPLDLTALKRRATVTHNKSLPEQARDAELLEVIAALERAVGLLREIEWEYAANQRRSSNDEATCPICCGLIESTSRGTGGPRVLRRA